MSDIEWMGRNEYARHRGCSANSVFKAVRDGRIAAAVQWDDGRIKAINWRLADELWTPRASTVPHDPQLVLGTAPAGDSLAAFALGLLSDDSKPVEFSLARCLRERLLALPDRMALELAAESDLARIRERLQAELDGVLRKMADALAAGLVQTCAPRASPAPGSDAGPSTLGLALLSTTPSTDSERSDQR